MLRRTKGVGPEWPATLSDESLLSGLACGDPDAGRAFVARFESRVYGLALGVLRDPALAEDVAQEAFVRAWKHAPAFDRRRGTVAAWLLRITRNLAIDSLRVHTPASVDPIRLIDLEAADDSVVEDLAVLHDTASEVWVALRQLPVPQSRALVLAAFHGLTAAEIAQVEGVPLGTAKTRIRLGLRRARTLLGAPDVLQESPR